MKYTFLSQLTRFYFIHYRFGPLQDEDGGKKELCFGFQIRLNTTLHIYARSICYTFHKIEIDEFCFVRIFRICILRDKVITCYM